MRRKRVSGLRGVKVVKCDLETSFAIEATELEYVRVRPDTSFTMGVDWEEGDVLLLRLGIDHGREFLVLEFDRGLPWNEIPRIPVDLRSFFFISLNPEPVEVVTSAIAALLAAVSELHISYNRESGEVEFYLKVRDGFTAVARTPHKHVAYCIEVLPPGKRR